jgi:glycosyltransferase involved in cell wall biosynthesis
LRQFFPQLLDNDLKEMVKLSIITINLNNNQGLIKTMGSVLNQTFKDFEYILIDGNSTDGSMATIQEHSKKIHRWISEPDEGIFNAMNKGIRMACGEYLLFLNSGDFLINENVLNDVFRNELKEDIICGLSHVSHNGEIQFTSSLPVNFTLGFFMHNTISHSAAFIKKTLFDSYGYYSEDLKYCGDWEFWIRTIILKNSTTRTLDIVISDYNINGVSSDPSYTEDRDAEEKMVIRKWIPDKILADYEYWEIKTKENRIMNWAGSKKLINKSISCLYKMAKFSGKLKSRFRLF